MNYIKHLNAVYQVFADDEKLNPTHISLYMALFQFWNLNRFINPFFINRSEVMKVAKLGSKNTYHKCLNELHKKKYLKYLPSNNPFKSSQVILYDFGNATSTDSGISTVQAVYPYGIKSGTSSGILLKHNKHINYNKQENNFSDFLKVNNDKNYNEPL